MIGALTLVSLVAWSHVWITGHPSHTVTSRLGDVSQELWFLAWFPHAVIHGHNPFFSNALWAGNGGVNILANPSDLLPAALLSPVTLAFGPVAALNLGALLAPVVSGWCMFCLTRKITTFVPGQIAAAGLWAFSPFMMRNLTVGHLNVDLEFFPPLLVLLILQLVSEKRYSPRRVGIALGALVVVQFFTGAEVLTITLLTVGLGCVVAGIVWWRRLVAMHRRVTEALLTSLAIIIPFLAYPVWYMVRGPRHVLGPLWTQGQVGEPVNAVVSRGPTHVASSLFGGYLGTVGPNPEYLGFIFLAFLLLSMLVMRRNKLAWLALIVGLFAWLLSLGLSYTGSGPVPLPGWSLWRVFDHVPEIYDIAVDRVSVIVIGAAAVLFAIALDEWWRWGRSHVGPRQTTQVAGANPRRPYRAWTAVVVTVAVVVLGSVVAGYSLPFRTTSAGMAPRWFLHQARSLPPGTRVLVMPFSEDLFASQALAWQAEAGLQFDLVGGYVAVPGGDGVHSTWYSPLGGAVGLLYQINVDEISLHPSSRWTPEQVTTVRRQLRKWGVQVVVVTPQVWSAKTEVANMTDVLGRPPQHQGGVWVWYRAAGAIPT